MCDLVVGEDDLTAQIDWERLFNDNSLEIDDSNFFDDINLEIDDSNFFDDINFCFCDGSAEQLPSPDNPVSLDAIEKFLINDDGIDRVDDVAVPNHEVDNCLFSDVLLDSPVESDGSRGEVVDLSDGGQKSSSPEVENNNNATDDGKEDDPISKKRKRQERNRDAALKSRERKKLYVKDLEMKSRYFEGECKRLGMLLNCVIAENQALRISLNSSSKAFDASMTKQESAVLLLESLLLGSLLWFLGTMCLLLPEPPRSTKVEVPLKNVDNQNRGSLAPSKAGSKVFELWLFQSFLTGKRCKASRSRMKPSSLTPEVLA